MNETEYVCADCGNEGNEPNGPCPSCKGSRIILQSVAEQAFGEDWRSSWDKPDEVAVKPPVIRCEVRFGIINQTEESMKIGVSASVDPEDNKSVANFLRELADSMEAPIVEETRSL